MNKVSNNVVKIPAPAQSNIDKLQRPEREYYLTHCTPAMRKMIDNAVVKAQDSLRNVGELGALDMCIKLARFVESQKKTVKVSQ